MIKKNYTLKMYSNDTITNKDAVELNNYIERKEKEHKEVNIKHLLEKFGLEAALYFCRKIA